MATAAEIKAANGGPRRGALSRLEISAWNTAHPDDLYETGPGRDDTGQAPDYPADDFEDMFPAPGEDTVPSPEGEADLTETPPRRLKTKPRPRGGGWLPWGKPAGKGKGKKKPRVSTEDLLGSVWRAGAKLATPLPALQREKEFEEKFGQSVDGMIQLIFAPLPDPADAEAVAAEEDAIRRAQGIL